MTNNTTNNTLVYGDVEIDLGLLISGDAQSFEDTVFEILAEEVAEIDGFDRSNDPFILRYRIVDTTAQTVILAVSIEAAAGSLTSA